MSSLIEADALKIALDDGWCPDIAVSELWDIVDQQPIIDAEPVRHGRWIKMTGMMPPEFHGHYECSKCGWHMRGPRGSFNREEEFAFCPNCRADMREDK